MASGERLDDSEQNAVYMIHRTFGNGGSIIFANSG